MITGIMKVSNAVAAFSAIFFAKLPTVHLLMRPKMFCSLVCILNSHGTNRHHAHITRMRSRTTNPSCISLIYGLHGRRCHCMWDSVLTYVACACASLLSSSAASPLTWPNVLLSASRCCCHCAGEQKNLDVRKLVKFFFLFLFFFLQVGHK